MRAFRFLLYPLAAILVAACSLFGSDYESTARISENGVDGIRFGDSIEEVREKLGPPWVVGWIDGRWRSWYHFTYGTDETHDTLKIYFSIPSGGPDSLSVVDAFVVLSTYSGTTGAGIGIGSTLQEVADAYGEPGHQRDGSYTTLYYCMEGLQAELIARSDTVFGLGVGFETPIPDYPVICQ